ncbi:hypothetical protein A2443_00520 [Candidatus Nomurabacteria bacterium RIFOXYC2_FULL_43_16]|uniref:Uncharacterized protein n=2 Tax=Candidatus Nomuraibacteriota TaxID=1752729 RepID=A0A1F6YP76_9BACT|nr:MAG: hypothetical protein UV13_C0011G0020 [Parcubacteria group bacterium GW2011_GWC1_42_21]KKS99600.1 MAG: hypothetical protein UV77_C0011G0006 [Candidatus Nomurabacteria bacterium GW2011_GWA1_43_17]KKT10678.1 MAG: hypothetical protein UV91_C0011G0014 [Candidatus Nomurabacteria bacterium GW2011_GWF2_43_24]OGJ08176.1 MAG: hypothetical protein A2225_03280 [Candidatus Nomurabacteria bacterium RIFOXYA2_FULL_42_12]OGJ10216.1 MAG: hypothetical protein A2443_00520 [Candidatus Nomurabacteria bacteri
MPTLPPRQKLDGRVKEPKDNLLAKRLSARGLVAEREEGAVVEPRALEVAEVAVEAVLEAPIHSRHAGGPGVERETLLLVKRGVPVPIRQLATLRVDDLDPLGTDEVRADALEERQALLAGGHATDGLLVGTHPQTIAGLQHPGRVREVHPRELRYELVVLRHHDDAEVSEQSELHDGLDGLRGRRFDVALGTQKRSEPIATLSRGQLYERLDIGFDLRPWGIHGE